MTEQTTDSVAEARRLVNSARSLVVLTGAGISTDSGIPDFRGPQGVWTKDPASEKLSSIEHYVSDPDVRRQAWARRVGDAGPRREPNGGHRALVELERRGILDTLITQNVDGLHIEAGSDPDRVVEIHGSGRDVVCLSCDYRSPMSEALDRVRSGEDDPACPVCGGILKSGTISFGQGLVATDLARSDAAARRCDVMMAVGTTLSVYPIANVVPIAKSVGATVIIVNGTPTEMDDLADIHLVGSITEILTSLVASE